MPERTGAVSEGGFFPLLRYAARNRVAALLTTFLLLTVGMLSMFDNIVERYPTIDLRTISITVPYDGATPREVEEDILRRIEESLGSLDGVERITSNAWEGRGEVLVELRQWIDAGAKLDAVRTAVASIEDFPPANADEPEVMLHDVMRSVLSVAVTSPVASEHELRAHAENLRSDLLFLPNVRVVDFVGARERQIQVDVDESALRRYGLTVEQVVARIREASLNVSGGEIASASGAIIVSALDRRIFGPEFADIVVVRQHDGSIIRLGDLAVIRDGFVDDPLVNTIDGAGAVLLEVSAPSGIDPQAVYREVEAFLADHQPPRDIAVSVWLDKALSVQKPLLSVADSALVGALLVFAVLVLLFDLRLALWIAVGIPTAVIGSFVLLTAMGETLNLMVVIGIAVVVGIVVDDAMVVGESIARARELGLSPADASLAGVREVIAPVTVGVLTTLVAFSALLPLDGALGQMYGSISAVVFAVLLVSLVDAFLLLPSHVAHGRPLSRWPLLAIQTRASRLLHSFIDDRLVPLVAGSLKIPLVPLGVLAGLVVGAVGMFTTDTLRFNASGSRLDEQQLQVDLTMAPGTVFEDTLRAAGEIVQAAYRANAETGGTAVNAVNVIVGEHKSIETLLGADTAEPAPALASVQLRLNTWPEREIPVSALKNAWIDAIGNVRGAERLRFPTARQYSAPSVGYVLQHPDERVLISAASEFKNRLQGHPWIYEIDDTIEAGNLRYELHLNETGRAAGLTRASLAAQVRHRFFGLEAHRVVRKGEEIQVMVRYPVSRRASRWDLQDELIRLPSGEMTPFFSVAEMIETRDLEQRQRVNGLPSVTIVSYFDEKVTSSRAVQSLVEGAWLKQLTADYPGLRFLREGVSRDTKRIVDGLSVTFPAAVLVMLALMSIQLRSFAQPLYVVLVGVPVTLAGAFYLHYLMGFDVGITSLFGLVAVTGVVVNDGVILLDAYNRRRRSRPEKSGEDAIVWAVRRRARPIILTTVTTVLGLLPILLNESESVVVFFPLIVGLIGGLALASMGLLFGLPAALTIVERFRKRLRASTA